MCEVFVKADPALYACRARSVRLHGAVTSIRLENQFWQVLQEIAARDRMTINQLITRLYDEIVAYRGAIDNFASFLRVCCLRYMSLIAAGEVTTGQRLPLAQLKAGASTAFVLTGRPLN